MNTDELAAELEALGIRTLTAEEEAALNLPDMSDWYWQYRIIKYPSSHVMVAEVHFDGDDNPVGYVPLERDDPYLPTAFAKARALEPIPFGLLPDTQQGEQPQ